MLKFGSQVLNRTLFSNIIKPADATAYKNNNALLLGASSVRFTGFFNTVRATDLWKSLTSVSNPGKKKGRGRGTDRKFTKNLNAGQISGIGKIRMNWPGLTDPVIVDKNRKLNIIQRTPSTASSNRPLPARAVKRDNRLRKIHPLDRGWSGYSAKGRKLGAPDPILGVNFNDFQSVVLQSKAFSGMTSTMGNKRKFFVIVAVGNGKGLIGLGKAKGFNFRGVFFLARQRAAKRLISIDLIEKHTVNHDFFSQFGNTKVFAYKQSEDYGLKCHRIITALCQLIGIKNLHVKVENSLNPGHIIKAFMVGLLKQKTYQDIANETKLHLVEYRDDCLGFPQVLASPSKCLEDWKLKQNPISFEEYIMGNRLVYKPDKKVPSYHKLPSWKKHLRRTLFCRNHNKVKTKLLMEFGEIRSHLADVYPECTTKYRPKVKEAD